MACGRLNTRVKHSQQREGESRGEGNSITTVRTHTHFIPTISFKQYNEKRFLSTGSLGLIFFPNANPKTNMLGPGTPTIRMFLNMVFQVTFQSSRIPALKPIPC